MDFNTFYEDVAHWVPEHDSFDEMIVDFSGDDYAAADQGTGNDSKLQATRESCFLLSDLILPPSTFTRNVDVRPQSEVATTAGDSHYPPAAQDMNIMESEICGEDSIIIPDWNFSHLSRITSPLQLPDPLVDRHLPYMCIFETCRAKALCFASTAELCRHKEEFHGMIFYDGILFHCNSEGCARGVPGYGFPNSEDLDGHVKHVHNSRLHSSSFTDILLAKPWEAFKTSEALGEVTDLTAMRVI